MLSEALNALFERFCEYRQTGVQCDPVAVDAICATLAALSEDAAALERQAVPAHLRQGFGGQAGARASTNARQAPPWGWGDNVTLFDEARRPSLRASTNAQQAQDRGEGPYGGDAA